MAGMDLRFRHEAESISMTADRQATGWKLRLPGDRQYDVEFELSDDMIATIHARSAGTGAGPAAERTLRVPYARIGQDLLCSWEGQVYRFSREGTRASRTDSPDKSGTVSAPTGGVVVELAVSVGQAVEADQPIAVIEAMKVMTPVDAPYAGTVGKLFVTVGQRVEQGMAIAHVDKPQQTMDIEAPRSVPETRASIAHHNRKGEGTGVERSSGA